MVLTISDEDYMRMKETLLDQQAGRGLKSHLDGK